GAQPDQQPEREERGSADRDELPVDVDEDVRSVRADPDRERRGGCSLPRLEPPQRRAGGERPGSPQPEQEQEADDARLAEELQRQVVRLGGDDRALPDVPPGDLEGGGPLAAERRALEERPRLLPPRPAVARAELSEPRLPLGDLPVGAAELVEDRPA